MMQVDPISNNPPPAAQPGGNAAVGEAASSAFGLSFESLLRIILTQLTYQDPLKPMDNFEFVSQLAQFSQLQIGQTGNDRLQLLVSAQGNSQATGLLGRIVDIPAGSATLSGRVVSIAFAHGEPRLTIRTEDNQTISNLAIGSVSQIREGD
jgi:flagellar basal-body rod modification protein FlgD